MAAYVRNKLYIKQTHEILDIIKKCTSNKVAFIKFISDVWENKIVPVLSKMHGTRWPGFDDEQVVKTMLYRPAAVK